MTLIVGAVNRRQAVLVSDRRVSWNGRLVDDESSKAITFLGRDSRLAISFTGLAQWGDFSTRRWIIESLADEADTHELLAPTIESFTKAATAKLASLDISVLAHKFLTIVFVGYLYEDLGSRAVIIIVSNFEDWNGPFSTPGTEFKATWMWETRPFLPKAGGCWTGGMAKALRQDDFITLRTLVRDDKPAEAIVGKAVDAIRTAADFSAAKGTIGKQCMSIVLPSEISEPGVSEYHSATLSRVMYRPSHVEARGGEFGVMSFDGHESGFEVNGVPQVLAGPKRHGNQWCWCASGKKYGKCHGR